MKKYYLFATVLFFVLLVGWSYWLLKPVPLKLGAYNGYAHLDADTNLLTSGEIPLIPIADGGTNTTTLIGVQALLGITPQIQSDFLQSNTSSLDYINNKPKIYVQGVLQTSTPIDYFASSTVTAGAVTFNLTTDGTASGTPACNTIIGASVYPSIPDTSNNYSFGNYTFAANKKTFSVTANKLGFSTGLAGLLNVLVAPAYSGVATGTVNVWVKCF